MMNQLEINLTLWAICSILLFEILIIICLCRCWFNRIKPKKFFVKRNEYEYLPDTHSSTQSKYQSTILRPPHADELAHVGTIRVQDSYNGIQNLGFYRDDKDERISPVQRPLSQQWIELQPPMINTAQLPPADYEIYPYPTDDYSYRQPIPRPTFIDFHQYRDDYDDDEIEKYRFQSFRRPEIILPRLDTSTEYYGTQYTNIIPKSILKTVTSTTSPVDLSSTPYLQLDHSRTDESPRTSFTKERRIPIEPILSSTSRMNFAYVNHLNDIEWEIPREFQTIFQRNPPLIIDSKIPISWPYETNTNQTHYSWQGDITQQQAFEY